MVEIERQAQVRVRIEVQQDIAGRGKVFGADTSENVAEDIVVILFNEDRNLLQRPEDWLGRHVEVTVFFYL